MPASELAWKQGANAIEGDFHLTADGRIVCIHDDDTRRVSGIRRVVKDSTPAELQALDAGAWFKPERKGTRLPTFREVAATVPAGRKFYIEVKCGPEIVPALLREIGEAGLKESQVVVISFHAPVIRELKTKAPAYKACWLSSIRRPTRRSTARWPPFARPKRAVSASPRCDHRSSASWSTWIGRRASARSAR